MARASRGCIDWYLHSNWDLQRFLDRLRQYTPALSGALFGAAWWVLVDAVTYSRAVLHKGFPWSYVIPGCVATLALVSMNLVSREQLAEISDDAYDEGAGMRARCWLFFSYMVAFGAVAGSVAVLIQTTNSSENTEVGVAGLVQTGLVISSGLLLWAFRTQDDDSLLTF